MRISGSSHLTARPEEVYQALNEPAVLVRSIPGCQRLQAFEENAYTVTVAAGVGSIKGVYDGRVRLTDQQPPTSFRLQAEGAGAPGTVSAEVLMTLRDADGGGTELTYDADATVGGMIGGVGQRMIAGVAKRTAGEFFGNVDALLSGAGPAAADGGPGEASGEATSAAVPAEAAPSPGSRVGEVFTAPGAPPRAARPAAGTAAVFAAGAVLGAVVALSGAVVGGWLAGRRR